MMALWKLPKWTTNLFEAASEFVAYEWLIRFRTNDLQSYLQGLCEIWGPKPNFGGSLIVGNRLALPMLRCRKFGETEMVLLGIVFKLLADFYLCDGIRVWFIWIVTTQWQKSGPNPNPKYQFWHWCEQNHTLAGDISYMLAIWSHLTHIPGWQFPLFIFHVW